MKNVLQIQNLKKKYTNSGPWAIDNVTCSVPKGSICALIGPNGAGKTTLYSIVAGYLPANEGEIDILGMGPFNPWKHRGRMGVLPQDAQMDGRLTCREFLHYMATLQGFSYKKAKNEANSTLKEVNLFDRADHKIASLSHGMQRRIATASALLGNPDLILLDEPMAGLDPAQAASLRSSFVGRKGKSTLVISSHNLGELEKICDWVIILNKGKLVKQGSLEEITKGSRNIQWDLGQGIEQALPLLKETFPAHRFLLTAHEHGGNLVHSLPSDIDIDAASLALTKILCAQEIPIRGCLRGESLETSFLKDT